MVKTHQIELINRSSQQHHITDQQNHDVRTKDRNRLQKKAKINTKENKINFDSNLNDFQKRFQCKKFSLKTLKWKV